MRLLSTRSVVVKHVQRFCVDTMSGQDKKMYLETIHASSV